MEIDFGNFRAVIFVVRRLSIYDCHPICWKRPRWHRNSNNSNSNNSVADEAIEMVDVDVVVEEDGEEEGGVAEAAGLVEEAVRVEEGTTTTRVVLDVRVNRSKLRCFCAGTSVIFCLAFILCLPL